MAKDECTRQLGKTMLPNCFREKYFPQLPMGETMVAHLLREEFSMLSNGLLG